MAKIQCDICGGGLVMQTGGNGAVCENCGLAYSVERMREMLGDAGEAKKPKEQETDIKAEKVKVVAAKRASFGRKNEALEREAVQEDYEELTESSERDFVLKKQFMGGYKLVGYNGCAQRVVFPNQWIEYDDHKLFAPHDEMVELIFPVGYTNPTFVKGNFENKPNLKKVYFGGDVLTGLNDFRGCGQLKQVEFENATMIQLGAGTFADCVNLETLVLAENAELDMQPEVFKNCRSLKAFIASKRSVDFAGEGIESGTFEGCTALREVVLPDNIKAIHRDAFKNCGSLEWVATHSGDLRTVAIHPEAFRGSPFQPANIGICPECGKKMRCTADEMHCSCGFSAVQYMD